MAVALAVTDAPLSAPAAACRTSASFGSTSSRESVSIAGRLFGCSFRMASAMWREHGLVGLDCQQLVQRGQGRAASGPDSPIRSAAQQAVPRLGLRQQLEPIEDGPRVDLAELGVLDEHCQIERGPRLGTSFVVKLCGTRCTAAAGLHGFARVGDRIGADVSGSRPLVIIFATYARSAGPNCRRPFLSVLGGDGAASLLGAGGPLGMVDFQPLEGMSKAESGGVAPFFPSTFSNVSSREYPLPRLPGMMRMSSVCSASLAAWSRIAFEVSRSAASGTVRGTCRGVRSTGGGAAGSVTTPGASGASVDSAGARRRSRLAPGRLKAGGS